MEKIRQNCLGFLDVTKKKKLRFSAPVSESLNCAVSNLVTQPICAEVDLLEENVNTMEFNSKGLYRNRS